MLSAAILRALCCSQVRRLRRVRRLFLEAIGGAVQPLRIRGVALISPTLAYLGHIFFGILVFTNAIGCLPLKFHHALCTACAAQQCMDMSLPCRAQIRHLTWIMAWLNASSGPVIQRGA